MAIIRRDQPEGEHGLTRRREWWDPFDVVRDMLTWDPFQEMRRMVAPQEGTYLPSFDVKETKDAYLFRADLPGVKEENLDLSITGNRLTVSGKREEEQRKEEEHYFTFERRYGSFARSFTLPEGVDLEAVNAQLKNGELTIHVPKKAEHQPKKISLLKGKEKAQA